MKRFDRLFRRHMMPLHFKLLFYFLLYGLIIALVLWIFQTFFLESFYTSTKKSQVQNSAYIIASSIEQNKNVMATIENIATYNSLSVAVYDTTTSLFTKQYSCSYDSPSVAFQLQTHDIYSYYSSATAGDGTYMVVMDDSPSRDDRFFSGILKRISTDDVAQSPSWIKSASSDAKIMIYCEILDLQDGSECFLVVTSVITPLSNTIEIIRGQMYIVIFAFFILAIIISLYASRKIANPISKTNKSAKELAKKNYDVEFDASGYLEVSELNDTLNYAKKELAATEKLQKELIANISHDLRTPLTMITGYGEVMRDLPGENTPENIQIIIDEATRLSSLVNDLLDLSKIQSGAIQPDKKEFCLTDSVEEIFLRYSKLREQDGYIIEFENCGNSVYVFADELKISQVIYNLVNNAVNYAGEDKTVIVSQEINGRKVRINVTDHGEGIPAEDLEYIWDRYYKVDKEHKRSVIGTGLGLSIVKGILDAHNAHYGVQSTPGKGSTFWFELDITRIKKRRDAARSN